MIYYFNKNKLAYYEFSFTHKCLQAFFQGINFITITLCIVALFPILILAGHRRLNEQDLFIQKMNNQSFKAMLNINHEYSFIMHLYTALVSIVLIISVFGLCGTIFKKTYLLTAYVIVQVVWFVLCTFSLLAILTKRKDIYDSFGFEKIR